MRARNKTGRERVKKVKSEQGKGEAGRERKIESLSEGKVRKEIEEREYEEGTDYRPKKARKRKGEMRKR